MRLANEAIAAAVGFLLYPFRGQPALIGLAAASVLAAAGILLIFKRTANHRQIDAVKRSLMAALLEIALFNHDLRAIGRAQWEIITLNLKLLKLSLVPLLWCPWSLTWLQAKAYKAHAAEQYEQAIGWYDRVLAKDPKNAWAYINRSYARQETGDMEGARKDYEKAREIDPAMAAE